MSTARSLWSRLVTFYAEARVSQGLALLDATTPGWESRVVVARLDVANGAECPAGQVYGSYGFRPWSHRDGFLDLYSTSHGFVALAGLFVFLWGSVGSAILAVHCAAAQMSFWPPTALLVAIICYSIILTYSECSCLNRYWAREITRRQRTVIDRVLDYAQTQRVLR